MMVMLPSGGAPFQLLEMHNMCEKESSVLIGTADGHWFVKECCQASFGLKIVWVGLQKKHDALVLTPASAKYWIETLRQAKSLGGCELVLIPI